MCPGRGRYVMPFQSLIYRDYDTFWRMDSIGRMVQCVKLSMKITTERSGKKKYRRKLPQKITAEKKYRKNDRRKKNTVKMTAGKKNTVKVAVKNDRTVIFTG